MEIIPVNSGELTPQEYTVEELRDNLLLGIRTLVREASGVKEAKEFELLYGRHMRQLRLIVDHIIILAGKETI